MRVVAPAKINRSLYIVGKRPDGYHDLATTAAFTEFGDVLAFEPSDLLTVVSQGEFAGAIGKSADNLVVKAAQALNQRADTQYGARITLTKNIPVGAGLGGGSADAAAALKALNDFWRLGFSFDQLCEIGATLGSDVPMCLHSVPLVARGRGEVIVPINGPFETAWFVLVHPRIALLTKDVFARVRPEVYERAHFAAPQPESGEFEVNHLQEAAIELCPEIAMILAALKRHGKHASEMRMTGSGTCCYALFYDKSEAEECFASMQAHHPKWWVKLTKAEL